MNSTACEMMRIYCELKLKVHIKSVNLASIFWNIIKNRYQLTNLSGKKIVMLMMIYHSQRNFKSIIENWDSIKKRATKLTKMGSVIKPWLFSFFFHLSLNKDRELYIFQMINNPKAPKRKLGIGDIITALVNHSSRVKIFKETLAKLAKFYKQKKSAVDITTSQSTKKYCEKRSGDFCDLVQYNIFICDYFISLEQRPSDWKPLKKGKYLVKKALAVLASGPLSPNL